MRDNKINYSREITFLNQLLTEIDKLKENQAIIVLGKGGTIYSKGWWVIISDTKKLLKKRKLRNGRRKGILIDAPKMPDYPPFPRTIYSINEEIPGIVKITFNG